MQKKFIGLPSSDEHTAINTVIYSPKNLNIPVKGIVQVVHGMTEHMGRYDEFGRYFVNNGYVVVGNDIISHGRSAYIASTTALYMEDWFDAVKDISVVKNMVRKSYPNVPIYLIGFSLGSFLVRSMDSLDGYEKEILIGTGQQPAFLLSILNSCIKMKNRNKMKYSSDEVTAMAFGSYNKHFKDKPEDYWLLTDPAARDDYENDIWVKKKLTPQFFSEFLNGMIYTGKKLKHPNNSVPTLFLYGKEDPVSGFGKGITEVYTSYMKENKDTWIKSFPGTHDILHDKGCEKIFAEIRNFISE